MEDWFQLAPPKRGKRQWVDGRSAKELAKAFFPDGEGAHLPDELELLLASVPELGPVRLCEAIPEHRIRLDHFAGETRNADLACLGNSVMGPTAVTVEAKADESFGPTISERLAEITNPNSRLPKRVELLIKALFRDPVTRKVESLRYQLIHATAASLIYAKEQACKVAVFVIYEFIGESTDYRKLERNASDLATFLQMLSSGSVHDVSVGTLLGPFDVPGGEYVPADIPLYLGKVSRQVA